MEGLAITRHSHPAKITALMYHYPVEMKDAVGGDVKKVLDTGTERIFNLNLNGLHPHCKFTVEILDKDHGNVLTDWQKMGSPPTPTREQTGQLKLMAMHLLKETITADAKGSLNWQKTLAPWSCVLINEV